MIGFSAVNWTPWMKTTRPDTEIELIFRRKLMGLLFFASALEVAGASRLA
jgi:hypothetical protein